MPERIEPVDEHSRGRIGADFGEIYRPVLELPGQVYVFLWRSMCHTLYVCTQRINGAQVARVGIEVIETPLPAPRFLLTVPNHRSAEIWLSVTSPDRSRSPGGQSKSYTGSRWTRDDPI